MTIIALALLLAQSPSPQILLEWDANTESNLAGYIVFWGTTPTKFDSSLDVKNKTRATIAGLQPGVRYYFIVKAYDEAWRLSPGSDVVSGLAGTYLLAPVVSVRVGP